MSHERQLPLILTVKPTNQRNRGAVAGSVCQMKLSESSKKGSALFAVLLMTCALAVIPSAASAAGEPPQSGSYKTFTTPDGNIICALVGGTANGVTIGVARCGIKKANWAQPKACPAGWEFVFLTTTLGVKGSPSCVDNKIAPKRVLAVGKKIALRGITCSSAKKGVTCIKANGHGFFISRASYKLF